MKRDQWLWVALAAVVVALWWKQKQAEAHPPALVPSSPGSVYKSLIPGVTDAYFRIPFVGGLLQCYGAAS